MIKKFLFVARYIRHLAKAKRVNKSGDLFIDALCEGVVYDKRQFYAFESIDNLRKSLLSNNEVISITDLGAGSNVNASKKRKISDLAANSAKASALGEMMFKLIQFTQPQNMLELGTSLGISACYQAAGNTASQLTTLEGCPETAKVAAQNIASVGLTNVKIVVGDFSDTLKGILKNTTFLDYVFFDGNHQKEPTIAYFEACLPFVREQSVFVFDDIHWSSGMEEAWAEIQSNPKVSHTIDLFWVGLVFFKKKSSQSHLILRQ